MKQQEAVNEVKRYADKFRELLEEYGEFLEDKQSFEMSYVEIGDWPDFIFGMAFDGFDFMSLFTLMNLNNAESELEQLQQKVSEVQKEINEHYKKAENNLTAYIQKVRESCK